MVPPLEAPCQLLNSVQPSRYDDTHRISVTSTHVYPGRTRLEKFATAQAYPCEARGAARRPA